MSPAPEAPRPYLVSHQAPEAEVTLGEPSHPLSQTMLMVRSERSLSRVYHAVKRQLPPDTPLLVGPLSEPPKFKGMSPGALKWRREVTS